jgi:alkylation response protein AidB-like acyl-CoA dehydrogenase
MRGSVPLDLPGVSRGKPLDKIGQCSLPQGEIHFDTARVPLRFAVGLRDACYGNQTSAWSHAGTSGEYPIEKIFRDARAAQIEDGENTTIAMRVGLLCQQLYAEGWAQN